MNKAKFGRRQVLISGTAAMLATGGIAKAPKRAYRRIACEEAFITPAVLEQNARTVLPGVPVLTERSGPGAAFAAKLRDLGPQRIAQMDADGIDLQLLLLSSPGVQIFPTDTAVALARDANDYVADACRRYPDRLAALAAIAPQSPEQSARELERAIGTLGFKGALINSHTNNQYLDDPQYFPIFEALEALDVPLYIHPREPVAGMREAMSGPMTSGAAWAYGIEVGTHILRLIQFGLFDRFPRLRIVIGHMGESLPFWLPRIDNRYLEMQRVGMFGGKLSRRPSEYVRDHIWITTSGMNYWPQLRMSLEVMGPDKVLYATDYPFEDQAEAVQMVERMPLSQSQKRRLFESNAAKIFRL